jgi:Protein of unknown function (DUF4197)
MKKIIVPTLVLMVITINACTSQDLQKTISAAESAASGAVKAVSTNGVNPLSNDEVISGLRNALTVGTNNSTAFASKLDGYYKNPALFIPFPPDAKKVKDKMDAIGFKDQTDKFVLTLNRAAEEAAKNAAPVFINAIKGMSIGDGFAILKGKDNAATQYLQDKTTAELKQKFRPVVQAAIDKVELTKFWSPIITHYNQIPFVEKQNPDLTAYVTERAMAGLFKLITDEELKIRKDPAARVTDILKRVFGSTTK